MRSVGELDDFERFGPYGYHGNQIGRFSIYLLDEILESRTLDTPPNTWDERDRTAYGYFVEVDTGVRFIEPHPDLDGKEVGDLHRDIERLHMALPFSEAERHWLRDGRWRASPGIPDVIWGKAEEVMQDGVVRVVQGRELVRRWWAWRREADEFADQGALEATRNALGAMIGRLVLPANWPRGYEEVQAKVAEISGSDVSR